MFEIKDFEEKGMPEILQKLSKTGDRFTAISDLQNRAERMRACALKVFKIKRWKTTTHAVESLIEDNRLKLLDCKMLTIGNSCTENIDYLLHILFRFFRLSSSA